MEIESLSGLSNKKINDNSNENSTVTDCLKYLINFKCCACTRHNYTEEQYLYLNELCIGFELICFGQYFFN